MKELEQGTVESSELVEATLNFWFADNEHIRTPFPEYIRPQLKEVATAKFYEWVSTLNSKAKDEVNDEIIAEKFEEIIFENAMLLVLTEDEKITIQYPFLPRLNDEISTSVVFALTQFKPHVSGESVQNTEVRHQHDWKSS